MACARIRRLTLTNFRSYHSAQIEVRRRAGGAGWAERRGQDQSHRGDLVSCTRARPAARDPRRRRVFGGRRVVGGIGRRRRRARTGHARDRCRLSPPAGEDIHRRAPMPHRSRAGAIGLGIRRSPPGGVAGAGHGRIVQRLGLGAAALSRPAGACGRCRAHVARQCARTGPSLAQPPARGPPPRSALARCGRT